MDFNRSSQAGQAGQPRPTGTAAPSAAPQKPSVKSSFGNLAVGGSKLHRWSFIALLLSATALFIATIFFIAFGTPVNREGRFVANDKYQAVFVNVNGTNGGQVYFGKIAQLTPQYIRLTKVFYIQNQASDSKDASSAYNLVKLGCELHGPADEMIINRSEVFFWENLKADGQVTQKIAEFNKQNPSGEQKCNANTGSTQQSNGTTQSGGTATPTTTPAAAPAATTPATTTPPATTKKP